MSNKNVIKPVALAVGVALAGTFAIGSVANADTVESPFALSTMSTGYMMGDTEGTCGEGTCGGVKEGSSDEGNVFGNRVFCNFSERPRARRNHPEAAHCPPWARSHAANILPALRTFRPDL